MFQLIEAIPNVSEGRRPAVIAALRAAAAATPDVAVLDLSSDPVHHRTVLTLAGPPPALIDAALSLYRLVVSEVDLREHRGVHPRLGALDVMPFTPLASTSLSVCVDTARALGRRVASELDLPVYLYGAAALRDGRRALEDVRRGQFEGLAERLATSAWAPDFGPPRPHPSAGATAIGARPTLVAYNVQLATDDLSVARAVARAVRERDGGLPAVKALGLRRERDDEVQVSMNLTDYRRTGLYEAFSRVRREADRYGVAVRSSEIVGLVPAAALAAGDPSDLLLVTTTPSPVLETRLAQAWPDHAPPSGATT